MEMSLLTPRKERFFPTTVIPALLSTFLLIQVSTADIITFDQNWGEPGFNLISQSDSGIEVIFSIRNVQLGELTVNGETCQTVAIPGAFLPTDAGAPNLPSLSRFVAVPQGSQAELEVVDYQTEVYQEMNIAPAFVIPRDDDDRPLQYKEDPEIYNLDAYYPAEPVILSELRKMRGVDVVLLGITPFQYNPVSQELIIYRDIRFRVNFNGGSGHFGEDRLRSRWWEPVLQQNLLNYASLPKVNFDRVGHTDQTNVEYLIIVPDDPDFIAWADTIKQWRNEQGIITGITNLTDIGGNNFESIRNYIDIAYHDWEIPPVAVLLLSDYENSGDRYGITSPPYYYPGSFCVADNQYVDCEGNDELPDLIIGRICAQNERHLQTMIGKMLSYEREPYAYAGFYKYPMMTGGWQDERWFILCTEIVWGYFHNKLFKDPTRVYGIYQGTPGTFWSTNINTWMVVNYFGPNGLGYIPQDPSYLTNWNGNAQLVNQNINDGCFLILFRDHGLTQEWWVPEYHMWDIRDLTNDMYPYLMSITCQTGEFQAPVECLVERFQRSEHGMLGLAAAAGTNYSFVADTYVWGFIDCMFPDFDPGYGATPLGAQTLMPALANASGKYYLAASSWPYIPQYNEYTFNALHHYGGAFMTLYSKVPVELTVDHANAINVPANSFTVTADEGSLIGISQFGSVLGRAGGTGAPVDVPIISPLPGEPMRITVTKPNFYRYICDITVTGGAPPVDIGLDYISGSPVPASGGNLTFDISLENPGSGPLTCDAWLEIAYLSGSPTTVAFRSQVNLNPGAFISIPDVMFPISPNWPAGDYSFGAKVGVHPDIAWDESSFPFTKSGESDGLSFIPFIPTGGFPNPFDALVQIGTKEKLPDAYQIMENYPNPFNPMSTIGFALPEATRITLSVFDISGRLVAILVDGWREAGMHEVTFDGSELVSGIYLVQLKAGDFSQVQKMVLVE